MEKVLDFRNKYIKTILFIFVSLIIMSFFYVHIYDAFVKNTSALGGNEAIYLNSGDTIKQPLAIEENELTNISILFEAYDTSNVGELFLCLYENDMLIQKWQLNFSKLDAIYYTFRLDSPLKINKENFYYISMSGNYEGENRVTVWTTTNTNSSCYYNENVLENRSIDYYLTYENVTLKTKVMVIMTIIFILVAILILKRIDETKVMGVLLLVIGLIYFQICPLGMVPDEGAHFWRAFEISCGSFVSEHLENGRGGNILPTALLSFLDKNAEINWDEKTEFVFDGASLYSPITYLPQALGIFIARCFTNNVSLIFYAGRLGNFIVSLLLCIWALYKIPFAKKIIFLIMMFPMTLQEMISMAPDGFIISLSLAFLAYILYVSYSENDLQKKDIIIITSLGIILSLCKIVYVVLILLVFMIPNEKIGDKKKWMTFKFGEIGIVVILNLIWLSISAGYLVEFQPGVNSAGQVYYVLTHIFEYYATVVKTIIYYALDWLMMMIGTSLGALNVPVSKIMWIIFFVLCIYVVVDCKEINVKTRKSDKWIFMLIFLLGSALVCTSLYVQWTAYQARIISGIQGRYFTPLIAFLALFVIYTRHEKEQEMGNDKAYVQYGSYYYMLIILANSIAIVDVLKNYF